MLLKTLSAVTTLRSTSFPGSSLAPGGGKRRDPGNEVALKSAGKLFHRSGEAKPNDLPPRVGRIAIRGTFNNRLLFDRNEYEHFSLTLSSQSGKMAPVHKLI